MSKKRFLTDTLGMTDDEADREIRQIADEGAVSGSILDKLEMGGAE